MKLVKSKKKGKYKELIQSSTYGKVTPSQLDITKQSQEVSPFPTGDHKASVNRHTRKHKNSTEIT